MHNIIAADLGDANIPKVFITSIAPAQIQTLFWREQSLNPADTTIEIWKTDNESFLIFTGHFGDGEWGQEDVEFFEEHSTIQEALSNVRSFFSLEQDEEPHEQLSSATFKRLIKKV